MSCILAIETAINSHSIALSYDGKIDTIKSAELFKQSDNLFVHLNEILERNHIRYQDLDKIAVTVGPGSFTGIRIGIAAVRGIKKVMPQIEIVGYTTLELMAWQKKQEARQQHNSMCLINAFASEFYQQEFDDNARAISDIKIVSQAHLAKHHYIALVRDNELFVDGADISFIEIDATTLLDKAILCLADAKEVGALYIKPPNIHGHNVLKHD